MKAEVAKIEWRGRPLQGALLELREGRAGQHNELSFLIAHDDYAFVREMLYASDGACSILKPITVEKAYVTEVVSKVFGYVHLVVEWEWEKTPSPASS